MYVDRVTSWSLFFLYSTQNSRNSVTEVNCHGGAHYSRVRRDGTVGWLRGQGSRCVLRRAGNNGRTRPRRRDRGSRRLRNTRETNRLQVCIVPLHAIMHTYTNKHADEHIQTSRHDYNYLVFFCSCGLCILLFEFCFMIDGNLGRIIKHGIHRLSILSLLSLSLSPSISLSLPLSHPPSLSLSISLYFSLFLSLPLSLSPSISLSLPLSHPPSLSLNFSLFLSIPLSPSSLSLPLPLSRSLSLSLIPPLSLPISLYVYLSTSFSLSLSHPSLSQFLSISLYSSLSPLSLSLSLSGSLFSSC